MEYTFDDDGSYFTAYKNAKRTRSKLNYNIYNNTLKIEDIFSEDTPNHIGTQLIIQFLKQRQVNGEVFSRIYGRFSSYDAHNNKWQKSIPFFANLSKYISLEVGLNYEFHLYYDRNRQIEITHCFQKEKCIDTLISEHCLTNSDMAFDLFLR